MVRWPLAGREQHVNHREVSIQFLRNTGLIPVKVRPGQKDPFSEWDPRTAASTDRQLVIAELQHRTELNLGALFAGRYIDLDNDGDSPFLNAALDYFLPRTPYIWGRKSKPKSHRVYGLENDFTRAEFGPILRFLKKLTKGEIDEHSYSLEVRGGVPENGLFSVLPGSVHPSKELVEWDGAVDPTVSGAFVRFPDLLRGIRLAVVSAIVASYWVPGNRNDLSLALAGTFWRIRNSTLGALGLDGEEEAPEGQYVLSEDDAKAIFGCLIEVTGDNHGDERQRYLNLKNTWRKLDGESGAKVTGGKILAELIGPDAGSKVVRALYRLLSDNDAAETVERLSERYVMWYGPGVILDLEMVQNNRAVPWMTREQAANSLGGKTVRIGDAKVPIAKLLFNSPIIHRVGGLTFDPSNPELVIDVPGEGAMVNQWRGFAVCPSEQQVSKTQILPFHEYVTEVLADGNEATAHWIFAWLADFLQNPAKKPGTALVLVGVEGAGKTFLGEMVLGKIIGPAHYGQTNSVTTLTHNFNTIIDNKIFIQCDEAVHSYQKDVASRLKSIITDEKFIVEPKGINAYIKPNHMRFLFTSNEEAAAIFVSASRHERRFTVLRVPPKKAGNLDYWRKIREWTEGALPLIMRWLQDYRYDRQLIMRPFETEAKRELQRTGLDPEVSWILTRIAEGFPLSDRTHKYWFEAFQEGLVTEDESSRNIRKRDAWPNRIMQSQLEEDYRAYTRSMGKSVYSGSLITTLRKVFPPKSVEPLTQRTITYTDVRTEQVTKERVRLYSFPATEEIIQYLQGRYGEVISDELKFMQTDEVKASRGEV